MKQEEPTPAVVAQPVISAAEVEQFRQFQAFQAMQRQQQQMQMQLQQPQPVAAPTTTTVVVHRRICNVVPASDCCAAKWCCCTPVGSIIVCIVFAALAATLSLVTVALGWINSRSGYESFFSMIPAFYGLFLMLLSVIIAASRAGCCGYSRACCGCCNAGPKVRCFGGKRSGRCGYGWMIAATVLISIDFFLMSNTWVALYSRVGTPIVGSFSLFVLAAGVCTLVSTSCFLKHAREQAATATTAPAPQIEMQAIASGPAVRASYPVASSV